MNEILSMLSDGVIVLSLFAVWKKLEIEINALKHINKDLKLKIVILQNRILQLERERMDAYNPGDKINER